MGMIKSPDKIRESEAAWNREIYSGMGYLEALARFEALWIQARLVNPESGHTWEEDIEADITLARVLNGLPAHT